MKMSTSASETTVAFGGRENVVNAILDELILDLSAFENHPWYLQLHNISSRKAHG